MQGASKLGDGEESLGMLTTEGLMDQDKRLDFIPVGGKILGGLSDQRDGIRYNQGIISLLLEVSVFSFVKWTQ